jgi:hypothetical protein
LRLEKSLMNKERMGVLTTENEWDFDVYATRLGVGRAWASCTRTPEPGNQGFADPKYGQTTGLHECKSLTRVTVERVLKIAGGLRRTAAIVAFHFPRKLFGWSGGLIHTLSAEAATDTRVLFLKRNALLAAAIRDG